MPKGKEYWIIKWTKGFIILKDTPCPYETENNIMYVSITDILDNTIGKIAVYEKIDNKEYSIENIRIKDDINFNFIKDEELIGTWRCINFVDKPKYFNPEKNAIKMIYT